MQRIGFMERARSVAAGCSRGWRHLGTSHLSRRQRTVALGAAAGLAGLLIVGATLPAGAKGEFVISAGGATVTIPSQVTIKAGPVNYTGAAQQAMPRFVSNVGHYAIGQGPGTQAMPSRQIVVPASATYGCPPAYGAAAYDSYSYGGLAYGGAGYGVPLYDYRAKGTYFRPRANYGYGYDRSYGRPSYGRLAQQQQPREAETLGTFNMPSGNLPSGYVAYGVNETPRPTFEPRIVQLAAAPQRTGPMPIVHKPAGKNHIRIE